jgi:class 3 adenylate cyclase
MFCDLVGSTPLARYDPEDLREVIGAYHRCIADTVAGFVARRARWTALVTAVGDRSSVN